MPRSAPLYRGFVHMHYRSKFGAGSLRFFNVNQRILFWTPSFWSTIQHLINLIHPRLKKVSISFKKTKNHTDPKRLNGGVYLPIFYPLSPLNDMCAHIGPANRNQGVGIQHCPRPLLFLFVMWLCVKLVAVATTPGHLPVCSLCHTAPSMPSHFVWRSRGISLLW